MIPLAIPAVVKALPWRLIGWGVAALAVLALGWRVHAWREAYKALPGVQAALAAEEACADGSKCYERQRALTEAADNERARIESDYQRDLEALRARPPAPAVRLCRPAGTGHLPGAGPARPADGAAAGRDVPLEASGDIGQRLFDLADEADREALKLRYLQDWGRAMAAPQSAQPSK